MPAYVIGAHPSARPQIPIHGERPERKVLAIPVIPQVEHAWEPRTGMAHFFP